MQIVQTVTGTYHHFDLAHELHRHGHLKRVYSTYPWQRLKREGLPRDLVSTFPWLHAPILLAAQRGLLSGRFAANLDYANLELFDRWVAARLPECDAVLALSGSGLHTGKAVQARGGRYLCDRGSSHIRYQDQILTEEYRRYGVDRPACDPRFMRREEAEYAQADAITIPSEFCRRTFLEMGVPAAKLYKASYGVRLDRFWPEGQPSQDEFRILFAGQVSFRKGIPYLLEAFRLFPHPRKRLVIAGAVLGEIKPWLAAQDLSNVTFTGPLPQADLRRQMSTSHVMVLPSIEEGLALVQGQALACGCPLISSLHTGGDDLFTHGVEGFLVPIRSAQAIAERLQQLADDPDLRAQMSAEGLKRVQKMGGVSDYGDRILEIARTIIKG